MKIIELIGVVIIVVVVIGFLFIEDQTNSARMNDISSKYQKQITTLFNQSFTNLTILTTQFQQTLASKQSEIDTKTTDITNLNSQISTLTSDKAILQAKYDNVNGTITTRIDSAVLFCNNGWKNFTVNYNHAVQKIAVAGTFISPGFIQFRDARNNTTQVTANASKLQFSKSNANFTAADAHLTICLNSITQTDVSTFVNLYKTMLTYATNMTYEMIQANTNISNSTLVLHHWSLYNVSYSQYLNKTTVIENYIRNW